MKLIGNAYVWTVMLLSIILIVYMFQFFLAVPQLRGYFILQLIIPVIGVGFGVYGLIKTKNEKIEKEED